MEVENYIYKDNLLYPTYPLVVSLPHYFPSVSDRWFGEGLFLSVDNITVLVLVLIKSLLVCSHSTQTHTYI